MASKATPDETAGAFPQLERHARAFLSLPTPQPLPIQHPADAS